MTWELFAFAGNLAIAAWTFRQGWRVRAELRKVVARRTAEGSPGGPYRSLADAAVEDIVRPPPPASLLPVTKMMVKYCLRCSADASHMSTEDLCGNPRCPQVPHRHVTCKRCNWGWLQGLVLER